MSRETALSALLTLVAGAYAWATPPTRRLKLWSDVPLPMLPTAFLYEGGKEGYDWKNQVVPKRTIEVKLFVYVDEHDITRVGASDLNAILDALDAALTPQGADIQLGRNTLGGAAFLCRINDVPVKDPGDLDGLAMLVVSLAIILP